MQIISRHNAHRQQLHSGERVVINGIAFIAGQRGEPTAFNVTGAQTELFLGVDGYDFYHDDGSYSGPSLKEAPLAEPTVETVSEAEARAATAKAADQAYTEAQIIEQIRSGTMSPAVRAALEAHVPVITTSAPTTPSGLIVPADVVSAAPKAEVPSAPAAQAASPAAEPAAPFDYTDEAAVGALSRTDLITLAKADGLSTANTTSNADLVAFIVKAAQDKAAQPQQ